MWRQKISVVPVKIKLSAFSLLEVLVATSLSAFLLLLAASGIGDFYSAQTKQRELLYLQAEAQQLFDYFRQHFQHIGYQGVKRADTNFDLFQQNGKSVNIPTPNCIISFYDLNQDGCLGKRKTKTTACKLGETNNTKDLLKEIFAFKVENKAIYTFSRQLDYCVKSECLTLLQDCNGAWSKFTESSNFNVNQLTFNWKKENTLLQIDLELESAKEKEIRYSAKSIVFIFNQ